jgi:hypothetical protein
MNSKRNFMIFDFTFCGLALCFSILAALYGIVWCAGLELGFFFLLFYLGISRYYELKKQNKKEMNVQEELQKMSDNLEKAWEKYDKHPTWLNAYALDGLMTILERFVRNVDVALNNRKETEESK